jgi:hypothetical protein
VTDSAAGLRDDLAALATDWGVHVAARPVCPGHAAPLDFLASWCLDRPSMSVVCGPRGGGKSFLRALATHLDSIRDDFHHTRILGGSLSQSEQIYNALKDFDRADPHGGFFEGVTKTKATYSTGSTVAILSASPTSVRGPHIPTLCLDEVDEIETDTRDSALGMCMERDGIPASVAMTSTWHRVGGPMADLMERGQAGEFPTWTFCIFEALQGCDAGRSGPRVDGPDLYAGCPECPIRPFCHSDVRPHPDTGIPEPKAKRSAGHYAIDSLIQKVRAVSRRVFEADYLCSGPKADGLWFPAFDAKVMVDAEAAEYDPRRPAYLGVDSGVVTGACWFQVDESGPAPIVTVFADYLREGMTAESNARAMLEVSVSRCNGRVDLGWTDPAGGARNPVGPTVLQEYARVGLHLRPWPVVSVGESLNVLEGMVNPASGPPRLYLHPRCVHTIRAFQNYRRAKRKGQWMDFPEDPCHPHEDLIDALRGAIYARLPARVNVRIYS